MPFFAAPALADTHYVNANNGSPSSPYTGWPSAATNIQQAIDQASAGDTVLVTNGICNISTQIVVSTSLTIRSVNGPLVTTVKGSSTLGRRIFYITQATNVIVDGFAITGGIGWGTYGSGIFVDGQNGALGSTEASILNCIFTNNVGDNWGSGTIASGYGAVSLIRNCLVAGNRGYHVSGISGRSGSGRLTIESCTVARNATTVAGYGAAVYSEHPSTTFGTNCVVYDNQEANIVNGTWAFTCSAPAMSGTGNTGLDPMFVNPGGGYGTGVTNGNFHLQTASPARSTGTNLAWMGSATDVAGATRILDGVVDMGSYENTGGPLSAYFTGTPLAGLAPLQTVFTAVAGGDTSGIQYRWDFDGNGTFDTGWLTQTVVTNIYAANTYNAVLNVTNAAGESYYRTNVGYMVVSPAVLYVSPLGNNTSPYTNWTMASTTIQPALTLAYNGATIFVGSATYNVPAELWMGRPVSLIGVGGSTNVVVQPSAAWVRNLHIGAVTNYRVEGFTFRNANMPSGSDTYNGGGILADPDSTGLVQNCVITNNVGNKGAGICNRGVMTVRNCLIANNTGKDWAFSAGIGGQWNVGRHIIESCTFVSNWSVWYGGYVGFHTQETMDWHVIRDCVFVGDAIVIQNQGANTVLDYTRYETLDKSGWPAFTPGPGTTTNDPQFVTAKGWSYFPGSGSPCINAGTNLTWMIDSFDLARHQRITDGHADLGCYELLVRGTVVLIR